MWLVVRRAEIWHTRLLYLFEVSDHVCQSWDRVRLQFVVRENVKTIRERCPRLRLRQHFDLPPSPTALLTCVSLALHTMQGERINSLRRSCRSPALSSACYAL